MFSHLMLGANDLEASHAFYEAVFQALDGPAGKRVEVAGITRYVWNHDGMSFMIAQPRDGKPSTVYNGFTLGLKAASKQQVDAAVAAALRHGGVAIEDPVGWRETPILKLYLAYVRDPAGHKLCIGYKQLKPV